MTSRSGAVKAYSTAQLARLAGVSAQTVQRWVDAGLVSAWRTSGGHRRIDARSADAYLKSLGVRPARPGRPDTAGRAPVPGHRIRVLIVDDQPLQRSILTLEVEQALDNVEVISAANAIEALVLVGRMAPDVLVTDIVMPEVDGYRMIQHLQAAAHERSPIIIAVSGYSQQQLAEMGKLPATVPILYRPFDPARLCELLRAAQATVLQRRLDKGHHQDLPHRAVGGC